MDGWTLLLTCCCSTDVAFDTEDVKEARPKRHSAAIIDKHKIQFQFIHSFNFPVLKILKAEGIETYFLRWLNTSSRYSNAISMFSFCSEQLQDFLQIRPWDQSNEVSEVCVDQLGLVSDLVSVMVSAGNSRTAVVVFSSTCNSKYSLM